MRFEQPSLKRFGWAFPPVLLACWSALALHMTIARLDPRPPWQHNSWAAEFAANFFVFAPIEILAEWGVVFLLAATLVALAAASLRIGEKSQALPASPLPSPPSPAEGPPVSNTGAKAPWSKWLSRAVGCVLIFLMLPVGGWLFIMILLSPFVWDGCPDTGCHMTGVWAADAIFGGGWLLAFCVAWIGYTQSDRDRVPAWAYPLLGWTLLIVFILIGMQIAESAQHANARH